MTKIEQIKSLCETATKGPWSYIDEWSGIYDPPDIRGAQVRIAEIARTPDYKLNSQFISQSRTLVPELVELVEELHDALNVTLGHITGGMDGDWRDCDYKKLIAAALAKFKAWNEGVK